jgi:hypothetical protein
MWASASRAALPAPEEPPTLAMPAHDRIRRDDHQVLTPAGTPTLCQDPEQLVPAAKPSMWSGSSRPGQDGGLMA